MSENEQDAVVGALIRELQKKDRLLACLTTKAESITQGLDSVKLRLRGDQGTVSPEAERKSLTHAMETIDAIRSTRDRMEAIQHRLKGLGLSVRCISSER